MNRSNFGTVAVAIIVVALAGCATNPGDETLSFSRKQYDSNLTAPTGKAPVDGVYRVYSDRAPGKPLGEVRMTKGAQYGFREKAGVPFAFGQKTNRTDAGMLQEDVEFSLNPTSSTQRYYWRYEGK